MQTFSLTVLGCRVNHYEAEQIAEVLRTRGLTQVASPGGDVRVVHTCSVTSQAAKGSRSSVRRATRLTVLNQNEATDFSTPGARVIVTGCWATSDKAAALQMPGVDAVITHHDDVNAELHQLLDQWQNESCATTVANTGARHGTTSLPLLSLKQSAHQRAFLKIQDGCDAHCTYCIIPQLRPKPWSKPVDDAVREAQSLVTAGHKELVLTGIFLGAYGQPTALRRRQPHSTAKPLSELIDALCTHVPGLVRLRLSSLEPGDLTPELIACLRSHAQVVPHFHLPLQSGSDAMLRKMNRQYTRADYLNMVDQVHSAFDRPAITTDIICGFPGETEADFAQTVDVVDRVGFTHVHAFTYSARPKTAAARWSADAVDHTLATQRVHVLNALAKANAQIFARQFIGQNVTVLVEHDAPETLTRHGRSERYFDVTFTAPDSAPGDLLTVRIDNVGDEGIHGTVVKSPDVMQTHADSRSSHSS